MTSGNLGGAGLCSTDLHIHPADVDGKAAKCHLQNAAYGPAWSADGGDGCPLDDPATASFVQEAYGKGKTKNPFGYVQPLRMWVR